MTIIVAADENWAIGNKDDLLVRIKEDHRNFKALTKGNVVILGRKTLCTFPGGLPLKERTNIIMSRDPEYKVEGAIVAHSVEELLEIVKQYDDDKVFVIGGGTVYDQLLPYCNKAVVTRLDHAYEADTYFHDLDADEEWEITNTSDEMTSFDLTYHFVTYERK
ncbi:MAG: dihydrofolate reductase [Lachnospiraceae bacterium]|nr:dihydrofolate reductase [Lachnospiraceae bacterium]